MFQDTRPADLDAAGHADVWAEFRVGHPQERLSLLRQLRDQMVPVAIHAPSGMSLNATVWAVDPAQQRIGFSLPSELPPMDAMVESDEAVAVAYLESVKLQFDLHTLMVVRGPAGTTLQCQLPQEIYRFQRRNAYRVRPPARSEPLAFLRHPSIPDMQLALRVLDVSIGGCALWLPGDVPPLQSGTRIGEMTVSLDADTRFQAAATLQHVSAPAGSGERSDKVERGARVGCAWQRLGGAAERVLQRWIDQAQKRRRMLSLT